MKRYRCPEGHEWGYKDRVIVQVETAEGPEQVGYIIYPCPVCWVKVLRSLPNGEETASRNRTMKPFDEHAACPKCGWAIVQTSYHAGEKYGPGPCEEHLRRACQRCHYSWNEAPIHGEKEGNISEPLRSGD